MKALMELATKGNPEGHPDVFNEHFSSQFPKYGYLSVFSVADQKIHTHSTLSMMVVGEQYIGG